METFTESKNKIINNWWLLLILGILFLFGGMFVMAQPTTSMIFISTFFSVSFFIVGIFEIFFSLSNTNNHSWGWYLAGGILDLLIGIILLRSTIFEQVEILAFFIGFWLLFKGSSLIGYSLDVKKLGIGSWGWLMFMGIIELILSFIILIMPSVGIATLLIWISISLIFLGIYYIFLSITLKNLKG